MAHRAAKRPRVSLILAVRDGAGHLVRTVESVLNQSFADLQLVVADCASTDRTASILESFHDRDIRVELVRMDGPDRAPALRAALDAARGSGVVFMGQDDWLAPGFLEQLVSFADDGRLACAFPVRCEDAWDKRGEACATRRRQAPASVLEGRPAVRRGVLDLYERGIVAGAAGVLLDRGLVLERRAALDADESGLALVASCLEDAERVGVCEGACYHAVTFGVGGARPFDPGFAARCAREHGVMMGLLDRWGLRHDPAAAGPVHRRHVRRLIECIDNASVGSSAISSIERMERVQDIIDAEDAQASLAAVAPAAREFGIMYKPMAQRNAPGCCMGSRLREIARVSHLPIGPIL